MQTGKRVAFFIGEVSIAILCIGYFTRFYLTNILPDKQVDTFQPTECFLESKRLNTRYPAFHRYRADFLISYNVNGVQYTRWVSGNGLDRTFTRDKNAQEVLLSQFNIGSTYPCHYKPQDPQVAVLVKRHDWIIL
ncbi:MAG: hypothetical protein EPO11_09075 [Gammaproteobacteria bacterium]|nr:MAG: hypothetical protein EPO11_09075 [Gammaproteobacteria bacterium]